MRMSVSKATPAETQAMLDDHEREKQAEAAIDAAKSSRCATIETAGETPDLVAGQPWQLIETAPKDETRILGYFPSESEWYVYSVMCWSDRNHDWWGCSPAASGVCGKGHQPTHWMPLPEPPQNQ